MDRTCVLVADRLRARLFSLEPMLNMHHHVRLEEKIDLINRYSQLSYLNRSDDARAWGYDPQQLDKGHEDRKFAKEVTQELIGYLKSVHADKLILVAPPQFLGALREHRRSLKTEVSVIQDFAKELTQLSVPEIRSYLEQKILL